ncbi:MAG: lamin tail domain-containing protein [Saprospiraceae bacterium]|nr:lamin tail domain-containing protein [Saprospiraceae bacterium]MDW8230918.1 lamin tail domain-containing protein [Saprospiraceae bacterium]
MRLFFSILLTVALMGCLCLPFAHGQLVEDFSDGDFTQNPTWVGDVSHFIVSAAGELQLMAPQAGSSVLAVGLNVPDSAVWLMDVRLEFAPSATNLLRIYLMADQPNLLQANGYYLEIGENGNADALRLFRQTGTTRTLLSSGTAGLVAFEPVVVRLRVRRSKAGLWTVEARLPGGAFQAEGSANDLTHLPGAGRFFGFYCLYTSTRRDKFFFDNLSVLPDIPDTKPPVLLSASAAANGQAVLLTFDEELDTLSALEKTHYTIVGQPAPVEALFDGVPSRVRLRLAQPLPTGAYEVRARQIADRAGNVSGLQSAFFSYVRTEAAGEFDVLINEIMSDPTPSVGLPEVEWLEIYNRSPRIINLNTLFISDGGPARQLPAYLLYPDSFVVLTTAAGVAAIAPFTAAAVSVANFPSLNNTSDTLILTDTAGRVVDRVFYAAAWHENTAKRDGGWTLERVNPNLPCLERENWVSCPVLPGGTPGRRNAAAQSAPDTVPPRLLSAFPLANNLLEITFSEGLDRTAAANLAGYQINPPLALASAALVPESRRIALLTLQEPLEPGVVYRFWTTSTLRDCSGNPQARIDTALLGTPEAPAPQDIVVNEVLFNPEPFGSDFVELHNRSRKIFDLREFFIANFYEGASTRNIGLRRLMLPGEYVVFTPSPDDIQKRFATTQPQYLFSLALPSLPDDAGNVTLFWSKDGQQVTVDSFVYFDTYHNALLTSSQREGVSLERIRTDGPTNDPANWTSAARTAGGNGTPTRPNSQRTGLPPSGSGALQLVAPRLSPDGDGYEDFLDIRLYPPAPGYAATVVVYDSEGIPIRYLVRQQLVATESALRWDGDMEDGTPARPGIYILLAELYAPTGEVLRQRQTFALVRRF